MKVAITGANSFIGGHLLGRLAHENLEINALARTPKGLYPGVNLFHGDLLQKDTLNAFVQGANTVVNLVYLAHESLANNIQALKNLADSAIEAGVQRFIHCSTSSVYGEVQHDIINEDTVCAPRNPYAQNKLALEQLLLENYKNSFEIVIVRPTQVFGPKGKNLLKLIDSQLTKSHSINGLLSPILAHRKMNLVYIDNVVEAIYFLMCKSELNYVTYLVSDDAAQENIYSEVEKSIVALFNLKKRNISIKLPPQILKLLFKLLGKKEVNPRACFCQENLEREGFISPVEFKKGLNSFLNWYKYEHS